MDKKLENFQLPAGYFDFKPSACLRVTGEDAFSFLQGQFTQELRPGKAAVVAYGLWLNQKGRVLADSHVVRGAGDAWWIISLTSPASTIRDRLEAYVIADDVVIEDETERWKGRALFGEGGRQWLEQRHGSLPPSGGSLANPADGIVFPGRRRQDVSWEWLTSSALPSVDGLQAFSGAEVEAWRLQAGIPSIPAEVGPEDLPNEAGLEDVAISYTKGCYLGQEVMARLKAMGRIRRRLVRVAAAEPISVSPPSPLFQGEKKVGELRGVAAVHGGGSAGLAMCTLLALTPDQPLALAAGGPGVLTLVDRP